MNESQQIRDLLKQLAGTFNKDDVRTVIGTVVEGSYNNDERTVDVMSVSDNAEVLIPSVNLMTNSNDGWLLIPEDNSQVFVTMTTRGLAWVSFFSSLSAAFFIVNGIIQLQDGTFGGLIKIQELTDKLNEAVSKINTNLGLIETGITGAGGSYTPQNLSTFVKSDYENVDVIHGAK